MPTIENSFSRRSAKLAYTYVVTDTDLANGVIPVTEVNRGAHITLDCSTLTRWGSLTLSTDLFSDAPVDGEEWQVTVIPPDSSGTGRLLRLRVGAGQNTGPHDLEHAEPRLGVITVFKYQYVDAPGVTALTSKSVWQYDFSNDDEESYDVEHTTAGIEPQKSTSALLGGWSTSGAAQFDVTAGTADVTADPASYPVYVNSVGAAIWGCMDGSFRYTDNGTDVQVGKIAIAPSGTPRGIAVGHRMATIYGQASRIIIATEFGGSTTYYTGSLLRNTGGLDADRGIPELLLGWTDLTGLGIPDTFQRLHPTMFWRGLDINTTGGDFYVATEDGVWTISDDASSASQSLDTGGGCTDLAKSPEGYMMALGPAAATHPAFFNSSPIGVAPSWSAVTAVPGPVIFLAYHRATRSWVALGVPTSYVSTDNGASWSVASDMGDQVLGGRFQAVGDALVQCKADAQSPADGLVGGLVWDGPSGKGRLIQSDTRDNDPRQGGILGVTWCANRLIATRKHVGSGLISGISPLMVSLTPAGRYGVLDFDK